MPASWTPRKPRLRAAQLLVKWLILAPSFLAAAAIVPGVSIPGFGGALVVAAVAGALNALLPPLVAALRLPLTLVADFLLILAVDALVLVIASELDAESIEVSSFWWAIPTALVATAFAVALEVLFGVNDNDEYALRVIQRIARRSGERVETEVPGIVYLEIDGLAHPVLKRAMRDGNVPNMARWAMTGTHVLSEWETDLSSQTGASQAGILLGSNEDIPAFRWVEKETATLMTCSAPADCAEIERRHGGGEGLLARGGASRGSSSPSAASRRRSAPTPATARSSPTATT
jgi:uncharacterized membrane protein YvlD (DUF360 family)